MTERNGTFDERVREHRDRLERLAASDLPAGKWARALLDAADDADAGT